MTFPVEHEVTNREELARYVDRLSEEFRKSGETWENKTVDRFLDALSACLVDHGRAAHAPADAPAEWGFIAFVLGAAAVYE
ncbi:DUF7660 family protein [Streptacidiphilus jiangxiensis]|uniref:DUF7660 domain-containing protein n=1 Tax=Streptacidiphilus jiangxiensis TaxID=235985 RepID=A0A1H7MQX8_STRJI|nr:hypothetical protein [Streptacidiphilus jiangxiensis]SEL13479.1 hypothetical protein SAMN05414137_1069 [Streptacidiphilus jiangxiensis]